jgi:hypothetical protein
VLLGAHDHAGAVGLADVGGQQSAPAIEDVQGGRAELVPHHHLLPGAPGRDGVPVPAKRHQRLVTDPALGLEHGRKRRRHRPQRLGVGQRADRGSGPIADSLAAVQLGAQPVQAGLRLTDRDVVGQRAPPALGDGVRALLHDALAPRVPGRTDRDPDLVVQCDRAEAGGDPPRTRVADRAHPVEPPGPGQPAQPDGDLVQPLDQMRLVFGLGQPAAPPAGVRQRAEQQMRLPGEAPGRGWVGQLQPIPLRLPTGRVLDDLPVASLRSRARRTPRPQLVPAHPGGERLIRAGVAQLDDLVEQRGQPQVRIVSQPLTAVVDELRQPLRPRRRPLTRTARAVQIGADGLAVMTGVGGDRADRPPLRVQCLRFHAVLPCQHRDGPLRRRAARTSRSVEGVPSSPPVLSRCVADLGKLI